MPRCGCFQLSRTKDSWLRDDQFDGFKMIILKKSASNSNGTKFCIFQIGGKHCCQRINDVTETNVGVWTAWTCLKPRTMFPLRPSNETQQNWTTMNMKKLDQSESNQDLFMNKIYGTLGFDLHIANSFTKCTRLPRCCTVQYITELFKVRLQVSARYTNLRGNKVIEFAGSSSWVDWAGVRGRINQGSGAKKP